MKNKIVAIMLAVFFSFFSWLYTYTKNNVKFWVALAMHIIIPIWMIYEMFGDEVKVVNFSWIQVLWIVVLYGIWLYAIVDNSVKRMDYYKNYPN